MWGKYCTRRLQNTHNLKEMKQRLRTEWAKLDHIVIAAGSIISSVVDRSRSMMHILHAYSYSIANML